MSADRSLTIRVSETAYKLNGRVSGFSNFFIMLSSTNPQQTTAVPSDDDLDAQIAELNWRKAEARLAEVARRAVETQAETTRAALAKMIAEHAGTTRNEAEGTRSDADEVSGGPALAGGERGYKWPFSDPSSYTR